MNSVSITVTENIEGSRVDKFLSEQEIVKEA